MRIGIVGAGHMGSALACRWVKAGHNVTLSFSRNMDLLEALAEALGPHADVARPDEAVASADVVLLSVPFDALDKAIAAIGGPHSGKPLITTVSPYTADFSGEAVSLISRVGTRSAAEEIASRLTTFQVVEAFNMTFADLLARDPLPFGNQRLTIPLCGDDVVAKRVVSELVHDAGLTPLDVGGIRVARALETMATAWVQLAAASGLLPLNGISFLSPAVADPALLADTRKVA